MSTAQQEARLDCASVKQAYHSPQLIGLGSILSIVQNTAGPGNDIAGSTSNHAS